MVNNNKKKTVLITGGSGGLGLAIAHKLISVDLEVALTDEWSNPNLPAPFFDCDIRKSEEIQELYNWTMAQIGIPDVLILNAGVGIKEKLYEGDPEKWQNVFDVNVMGALRCIRAFVPQMLDNTGQIIFISSVSAFQPHEYGGVYSASKTALEILAETLRMETLPNLKVTIISPGSIDTNFFTNQLAGGSEHHKTLPKMTPEAVAEDVLYCIKNAKNRGLNKIISRPSAQQF